MSGTLSFLCGVSLWEVRNPQKQAQVLAEHPCPLVTCRMKVRKGPQASVGTNCGGTIKSLSSQFLCPAVLVRFKDPVSEWPLEGLRPPGLAEPAGAGTLGADQHSFSESVLVSFGE